ncbi:hydroxyacid dehydrogenase [Alicyclobacillus dauci]|uniref:Hydroxyacid dehydrogenase n=1 Tax=Alicyclobacillus dauci TaxID=1475485 RepID=A0ABY6Z5P4_9BACL|nr:hydroxyacid dehydrogenase [Alicyclobacillus dauci]WAH37641.1 hydroxyacid dehydrogenase [Alicyclobacillus dauci]
MADIVICEDLWHPLPSWLEEKYTVAYHAGLYLDPKRLAEVAEEAKALVVRNQTRVEHALLASLRNLRAVGRLGVGLDNINLAACRNADVQVVAARGCNANAVAEYVFAAMFLHRRHLHEADELIRKGKWAREESIGFELSGKTLGLIGVGDIGQRVAVRARAMGMNVLAYDPFLYASSMLVQDFAVKPCDMETVCQQADIISIHVPLTDDTYHLIGRTEFSMMKTNVMLINTARGGIVDEEALHSALLDCPDRFAVLDVREHEPPVNDQLVQLANTLFTPHVAGITFESSARVADFVLRGIDDVLSGRFAQGVVS